MSDFFIDPDIAKAKTIATDFYTDPHYFEWAKEYLFASSWQWIGDADQVMEKGEVVPFNLFPDFLDEPLMLTRDDYGALHCLSNVCTHRGNILVEKECKLRNIICKYHGRRFDLDGKFASMPEFNEVENFPAPEDNLFSLPLFEWGKWLFTSLRPDQPASHFLQDMMTRLSWLPINKFKFRADLSQDYIVEAHWALYCENYLEGFHIPFVHAGLNEKIDFGTYTTELFGQSSLQVAIAKEDELAFDLPPESPDFGKRVGGYYFWIYPNMMFNFYPWGLSINVVKPVSTSLTVISFFTYVWDESKLEQGAGSDLNGVELEDEAVVQAVQKGIRSRFYQHGRYSVTREQGTHHFHRLLSKSLAAH